jgi:hypothetical protein
MATVLTSGAWLFAPTRKPSFFARLLRARQRRAERVVEHYLAIHGINKQSDDAERRIERLFLKAGQ